MRDQETTVAALGQLVEQFVVERAWQPFHTPKNLAMALAVEAAELMEHFQWLTAEEAAQAAADSAKRQAVGEELADVLAYLLALARVLQIDLAAALAEKMVKNRLKYPVPLFRGRYGPEDPRPPRH